MSISLVSDLESVNLEKDHSFNAQFLWQNKTLFLLSIPYRLGLEYTN